MAKTPCDMFKVEYKGKVYPVTDYIYREPSVGIFEDSLTFGDEEEMTCSFPDKNNEAKVCNDHGKVIGKAKILVQK